MMISRYCSLVTFREVFFVNVVHRKPEKCGAKSCECMISVHREARYGERSERNDLPEAGLQGDFFYRHFEWIRYIM